MRDNVKRQVENQARRRRQLRKQQKPAKDVFIPDAISVSNLAGLLGARIGHFENKMRSLGMETIRHDHGKYKGRITLNWWTMSVCWYSLDTLFPYC